MEVVSAAGHGFAVGVFPFHDVELLFVLFNIDGEQAIALFRLQRARSLGNNGAVGDVADTVGDGDILCRIVDTVQRHCGIALGLVKGQHNGLLCALDVVVCKLLAVIVVDDRVGDLRPAVDEVPL